MNKAQKEVIEAQLRDEKRTLNDLKKVYEQAKADCAENIAKLNSRKGFEPENLQTIIYQKNYQEAISEQVDGALKYLNDNQYKTINDYVQDSYNNGYTGIMYDLHQHDIPIIMPINQEQVVNAVQIDSKISQGMYNRLGEDVAKLKDNIRFEVSRGIANGSTWIEVGEQLANGMNSPFDVARNNAMRIARTEGHRVQEQAGFDAMSAAKDSGADVVKQWSSTLDERTRPEHQEADGQIREIEEPFDVGGEELMMPGDGSAFNCINCRCTANMRARAALDQDELDTLKDRAKFYGLDKSKDFDDFKAKYLKLPDDADNIATDNVLNKPLKSSDDDGYFDDLLSGLDNRGINYLPVKNHNQTLSPNEIVNRISGGDKTQGSCASVGLAYIGQKQGWDVLDFRDGDSREFFSNPLNLERLSQAKGMTAYKATGKSSLTVGNRLLKNCEPGKEYYLATGRHASIVRKNDEGKLQYLELQSAYENGWKDFSKRPRETLAKRFGCNSRSNRAPEMYDFMLDLEKSDFSSDEFRSMLGYINTDPSKEKKGSNGTIK